MVDHDTRQKTAKIDTSLAMTTLLATAESIATDLQMSKMDAPSLMVPALVKLLFGYGPDWAEAFVRSSPAAAKADRFHWITGPPYLEGEVIDAMDLMYAVLEEWVAEAESEALSSPARGSADRASVIPTLWNHPPPA